MSDFRIFRVAAAKLQALVTDLRKLPDKNGAISNSAAGNLFRQSDAYNGLRYIDVDDGTNLTYLDLPSEPRVQGLVTDRLVADTIAALATSPGSKTGDVRHIRGTPYQWDASSTRAADGIATVAAAGVTVGRWLLPETDFGLHPKRAGAKCDGTTDDTDAFQATLNLARVLGTAVMVSGPMLFGAVNWPGQVPIIGHNAEFIPYKPRLLGRGALFTVAATGGQIIENVSMTGSIRSDGRGYMGKFLLAQASSNTTPGVIRHMNLQGLHVSNYWDQTFRLGSSPLTDGTQRVEDVRLSVTVSQAGPLVMLRGAGAAGQSQVVLTTQNEYGVAAKVQIGALIKFAGGGESYRVSAFDGVNTISVTPNLTRTLNESWLFPIRETDSVSATGAAGSASVTLSAVHPALFPGSKVAFALTPGEYVVQNVSGTALTLTTPLLAAVGAQKIFAGHRDATAVYLGQEARRVHLMDCILRCTSGSVVFREPPLSNPYLTDEGVTTITGGSISYGWILVEAPGLGYGTTTNIPAVTTSKSSNVLTVTNGVDPTAGGWTVGTVINIGGVRGTYKISAVTATTITVDVYDNTLGTTSAGNPQDAVTAQPIYQVLTAAGAFSVAQYPYSRLTITGCPLSYPTRENEGGYCVSVSGYDVEITGSPMRTWMRTALEVTARRFTVTGSPCSIANYEGPGTPGFGIAVDPSASTPNLQYWNGVAADAHITGSPVHFRPGTSTSGYWKFWNMYSRASNQFNPGNIVLDGIVTGLQGRLVNAVLDARADNVTLRLRVVGSTTTNVNTGAIRVAGLDWDVQLDTDIVGNQVELIEDVSNVNVFPAGLPLRFRVANSVLRNGRTVNGLLNMAGRVEKMSNKYVTTAGTVSYDQPPYIDSGLEQLKAWNAISPYTFGDNFRRANSTTLGTSSSGGAWTDTVAGWQISNSLAQQLNASQGGTAQAASVADGWATMTVAGTGEAWIVFRRSADGTSRLRLGATQYSPDNGATGRAYISLQEITSAGGVVTLWASSSINSSYFALVGGTYGARFVGSNIDIYINGVAVATVTSSIPVTNAYVGILGYNGSGRVAALSSFSLRTP